MTTPPPRDPRRPSTTASQAGGGPPQNKRAEMLGAVQDVMKKVQADRDAASAEVTRKRQREGRRHTRGIVLVFLGTVALVMAVLWAAPRWQHPFAGRSAAAAERDARSTIVFTSQMVDAFAASRHRLPHSLHEMGVVLPGIEYTELADRYQLSTLVGTRRISYVSTQNRDAFRDGR